MILYDIILYHIILYYIISYYIILYYITFCLIVYFYSTQQSYLYLSSLLFCSSVPTLISRIFLNKIQADFDYEPHISLMKIFESAAYIQENVVSYLFLFCSSLLHFSTLFYSCLRFSTFTSPFPCYLISLRCNSFCFDPTEETPVEFDSTTQYVAFQFIFHIYLPFLRYSLVRCQIISTRFGEGQV